MLQPKLKKVIENIIVKENTNPTIAVSGGIDSVTLAVYTSYIFKNKKVKVSHAIGPAVPIEATNRVKTLSKKYNWELKIINTNEISDPRYAANPINNALPGFKPSKPVVFCGLFPVDSSEYQKLKDGLAKLKLNDASFSYEPEYLAH